MPGRRNILLPVEVANRELDCRVFSACLLAKPGNRIFIGQHDTLARLARFVRGGIYIGKNIFNRGFFPGADLSRYHEIKNRGFTLLHLDEEGGNYIGSAANWQAVLSLRLDPSVLAREDRVCTWGDFQRDYYRSLKPQCAENIRTTGHPKFDLLKPAYRAYFEPEVARLRARLGDFILVNTNLTTANNPLGLQDSFSERAAYFPEDPFMRSQSIGYWRHSAGILGALVGLVDSMAKRFPRINIVIRPHPSEDFGFYRAVFRSVSNVKVLHEGGVSPWVLACRALVHNGCTTAIESHFAGTDVISFTPVTDDRYDFPLPNMVGKRCRTEAEVVDMIDASLSGAARKAAGSPEFTDKASQLFFNINGDSFARFSSLMAEVESSMAGQDSRLNWGGFACAELASRALSFGKRFARPFFPDKQRQFLFFNGVGNFPGFHLEDVASRISRAQRVLAKEVRWKLWGPELFSVEAG